MVLKDSVRLDGWVPQIVLAAMIADGVCRRFGGELRITSGNDSTHSGQPVAGDDIDPHYKGKAFDFGLREFAVNIRAGLIEAMKIALGPTFVVLWESVGTENEHGHVQWGHVAVT